MKPIIRALICTWVLALSILMITDVAVEAKEVKVITQRQYLTLMDKALDAIIEKCRQEPQHPIIFSANLFFAHEVTIKNMPLETLKKYVDALREAGVHRIDINMGLFPWLNNHQKTIQKYDALIDYIRQAELELAINPQYSTRYHKFDTFEDWRTAAFKTYPLIARRYQPDVFIIVHEPTVMNDRMGIDVSPMKWRNFTQMAARAVKKASPKSRCGAGVLVALPSEKAFFNEFIKLEELDIVTIDIYAIKGIDTANKMIPRAKRRGKSVYIEETWRPAYYVPQAGKPETLDSISAKGIGNEAFQDLDAKWLYAMTLYANTWRLEAVTPFWTQTFFLYVNADGDALNPGYNRQVIEAIHKGERTKTFDAFKAIIQKYGK